MIIMTTATWLLLAAPAAAKPWRVPVATLSDMSGDVATAEAAEWRNAATGLQLRTGDRLRTGAGAAARLTFPWTSLRVGPDTTLEIQPSPILAVTLERGRVQQEAEGTEAVRLETTEAVVRGEGRVILRRGADGTAVTVWNGTFRIEGRAAGSAAVEVHAGESSLVPPSGIPAPAIAAPDKPAGLLPGADPLYVLPGDKVALSWTAAAQRHHVQVLPIDTNDVLIDRDTDAPPPYTIQLPWLGTYRWRVAAMAAGGIEGLPSEEGLICVVEK